MMIIESASIRWTLVSEFSTLVSSKTSTMASFLLDIATFEPINAFFPYGLKSQIHSINCPNLKMQVSWWNKRDDGYFIIYHPIRFPYSISCVFIFRIQIRSQQEVPKESSIKLLIALCFPVSR